MEVSTEFFDHLVAMMSLFNKNKGYELEAKCKQHVSLEQFTKLLTYLRSVGGYQEVVHADTLDVSFKDGTRASLIGVPTIQTYCKLQQVDLSAVKAINKKKIHTKETPTTLPFDAVYFKIDLRNEAMIDDTKKTAVVSMLESADTMKGFRMKKRYSYIDSTETFKVDMTIVREAHGFKTFAESGVSMVVPSYEIELELIKRSTKDVKANAKVFLQGILEVYMTLSGEEDHATTLDEKKSVLQNYLNLVFGTIKGKKAAMEAGQKPKQYFAGPQPITLERKNVLDPGLGVTTIKTEYTVTEKADGERMLLFVSNTGKCYFINNRLDIHYTGLKLNSIVNSLLDGEFVESKKIYAVFDIYWDNGTDVRNQPLIPTRHEHMQNFVKKVADKATFTLHLKEFLFGEDVMTESRVILDKATQGQYPYAIDGLIFTPKNLPVGGSFAKDQPESTGTWNKVFKWKPPQDNTIDFMVVFKQDQDFTVKDGKTYKVLSLYVGYNPMQWEPITSIQFIDGQVQRTTSYIAKEFLPGDVLNADFSKSLVQVDSMTDKIACKNGDGIESNSIVEFSFDETTMRWQPLRVRHDKTEMLRRFGLSGTANDYGTAMNIWKSIRYPVTEDMITGTKSITAKDVVEDDVYYYRVTSRDKFASRPMLDFHNYWIKGQTLFGKMKGSTSLFDVSCGKGGDIPKWIDNGFTKVLGVDVARDNIENPVDGAYARTLQNKRYDNKKHEFVYVTLDSSKKFVKEMFEALPNEDDVKVCKHLWGIQRLETAKKPSTFGFIKDKFDVVSCQFSIHYFFGNEQNLDTLLWNVDEQLKPGGYFIGTCLDGQAVKKLLKNVSYGTSVQGAKYDRILWDIKKCYKSENAPSFGEEIEVFMESIGRVSREYLVNMEVLKQKLEALGITLHNMGTFEEAFKELTESTTEDNVFTQSIKKLTQEEKRYSFLNTWFIFCKKKVETKKKVVVKKK